MDKELIILYINKLKAKWKIFCFVVAVILMGLIGLSKLFHSDHKQVSLATVEAVEVVRSDFANIVTFSGKTQAFNSVNLVSQVTGQITAINFTQGALVKQGEVLFEIDSRQYAANLRMAEAQLAKDSAQLEVAQKDFERYQRLNMQKYISDEQFDQAQANRASLLAATEADKANIASAQLMLEYCMIKAPVSGIVGQVSVTKGNVVQADVSAPITTIMEIAPIYIVFDVDSKNFNTLRKISDIKQVPIMVKTDSEQEIKDVKIAFINNDVDPTTGSVTVKALYDNHDYSLWANQYVKVMVTMSRDKDVMIVPINAVLQNQKGYSVFVLDEKNIAHMKQVTVGFQSDKEAEILSGLHENELVVTSGQLRLGEGTEVQIINQQLGKK